MPNQVTAAGLETKTFEELTASLTAGYQAIYGADINVDSNSPDGQTINIFVQEVLDVLDVVTQVYAGFDPDQAIGTTLDARCALNGVKRLGGTFTTVQINVTVDRALTLDGLDTEINNPDGTGYTISDNAGNQFILSNTHSFGVAGTQLLTFRSRTNGAVLTTPNTITVPVTIILGVVSVNNPNPSLTTGLNQETDAALRLRRQKSVALSSQGYLDGLLAALQNIDGVTSASVYENNTGSTDADGIPGHSIWAIVVGGADADIAQAIYAKRPAAVGMKGATTVTIIRPNGSSFDVSFDRTATERLYISMVLNTISSNLAPTANTVSGNNVLNHVSSLSSIAPGMLIRGSGIPTATFVGSVDASTPSNLKISMVDKSGSAVNATASASTVTLTIVPIIVSDLEASVVIALAPGVNEIMNINRLVTLIQQINPNALVTFPSNTGFSSDGATFSYTLTPTAKNYRFTIAVIDIVVK